MDRIGHHHWSEIASFPFNTPRDCTDRRDWLTSEFVYTLDLSAVYYYNELWLHLPFDNFFTRLSGSKLQNFFNKKKLTKLTYNADEIQFWNFTDFDSEM